MKSNRIDPIETFDVSVLTATKIVFASGLAVDRSPQGRPALAIVRKFLGSICAFVVLAAASGCPGESTCDSALDCAVGEICVEGACSLDDSGPEAGPDADVAPNTTLTVDVDRVAATSVEGMLGCDQEACTFQCRVDNEPFRACTETFVFELGAEGVHVLQARALNDENLIDESPAEHIVTVDFTAPSLTIDTAPDEESTVRDGTIAFSCDEDCAATCALDGAPASGCESPYSFSGLPDGEHRVTIVATDLVENQSEPVDVVWAIDATPPVLTLSETPAPISNTDVGTFVFACDEDCAATCTLNGGVSAACLSPFLVNPGAGEHTAVFEAVDAFGNEAEPVSFSWVVDVEAPDTSIVLSPTDGTEDYRVQVGFECDDAPCTFECRLDEGEYAPCTSPVEFVAVGPGARAVSVRAIDLSGNVDESPALATWTQARTWTDIAASHHFCAIASNGSLWCWGDNSRGQVGLGTTGDDVETPTNVGGDEWADVGIGEWHTCATKTDGSLWCWGANDFGQLGLGVDAPDSAFPRRVGNANDWVSVWRDGASALHSCAVTVTGVQCWGRNVDGEVGIGSVEERIWAPAVVTLEHAPLHLSTNVGKTVVADGLTPTFVRWGRTMTNDDNGPFPAPASNVPSFFAIQSGSPATQACAADGALNFISPDGRDLYGVREFENDDSFRSIREETQRPFYTLADPALGIACGSDAVCQLEAATGGAIFCNSKMTPAFTRFPEQHQESEFGVFLGDPDDPLSLTTQVAIGFEASLMRNGRGQVVLYGGEDAFKEEIP